MSDLDKLIKAVEAGNVKAYDLAKALPPAPPAFGFSPEAFKAADAYEGSLDAAKALHDELLPGWDLLITTYEDGLFEVSVSEPTVVKTYDGLSEIIARAWLLAILRAYRETQP